MVHYSPQRMEQLENACRLCSIDFVKPVLDVVTRWNSTYDMLSVAIRLKPALNSLLSSQTDLQKHMLSQDEWDLFDDIIEFLTIFKDLTTKMSQNAPTVSWIIPLFNILFDHVEDIADGNDHSEFVQNAATQARHKLQEYYTKTNTTTMLCTLLDPRRKLLYFKSRKFPKEWVEEVRLLYVYLDVIIVIIFSMSPLFQRSMTFPLSFLSFFFFIDSSGCMSLSRRSIHR
jgi:hypothetical protein